MAPKAAAHARTTHDALPFATAALEEVVPLAVDALLVPVCEPVTDVVSLLVTLPVTLAEPVMLETAEETMLVTDATPVALEMTDETVPVADPPMDEVPLRVLPIICPFPARYEGGALYSEGSTKAPVPHWRPAALVNSGAGGSEPSAGAICMDILIRTRSTQNYQSDLQSSASSRECFWGQRRM